MNLTGNQIRNTYQSLLNIKGHTITDGTGSIVTINASTASYVVSASYAPGSPSISASYALTASYAVNGGGIGGSSATQSLFSTQSLFATQSLSSTSSVSASYVSGSDGALVGGALRLFNPTNNLWYTVSISGSTGMEVLQIA